MTDHFDPLQLDAYLAAQANPSIPHEDVEAEAARVAEVEGELADVLGILNRLSDETEEDRARRRELEVRAGELEDAARPRWRIDDDAGAEWAMGHLRYHSRVIAGRQALADDRADMIAQWLDRETRSHRSTVDLMASLLEDYNARRVAADPKATKRLTLPSGEVKVSGSSRVEIVDEAALRQWINEGGRKELLLDQPDPPIARSAFVYADPFAKRQPDDAAERPFVLIREEVPLPDGVDGDPVVELHLVEKATGEPVPGVVIRKESKHRPTPDLT